MSKGLTVIGIGSSAGGLEALQILLSKLGDIPLCSFIIAQHLSPTHRSMMVELLNRVTNIPVIEATNGLLIKPKTIYMTPENTDIYVSNGKIYLKSIEATYGPKPSVNYFFNSLAQAYGEHAIGVILSGTGSDGAFGIRAIKAAGGITITQSPATAKYDGMPVSAINTGKVDLVIPIDMMAGEIQRIVANLGKNVTDSLNDRILQQIYRMIFDEKGVDFSQYKTSTLIRRIERRMAALHSESLSEYVDRLKGDSDEVTNLYHDILIGVTEFFRDPDAFKTLLPYVQEIVAKKEVGEEIRLWVIGCSTGEEAYTLAILLSEVLQDKISRYKIKIFATDIDDEALKIARAGVYAETSLTSIDKNLLSRYFIVQKNQFEVKKSIRELVIFSHHNVIADSPFLRLDFISCRNMLIYFNQTLQNRFFPIVHYALKDQGILFLGKSESVGQNIDLFVALDKQEKIFRAQYTGVKEPPKLYSYTTHYRSYEEPKPITSRSEEELLEEKIFEATQTFLLSRCVIINSSNDIIYVKGENPYLVHPQGRATNNIFKCVREELVLDLRTTINEAVKSHTVQSTPYRQITIQETLTSYVKVLIVPIESDHSSDTMLALFFDTQETDIIKGLVSTEGGEDETVTKLSAELTRTKTHLQNVIEELETSYEEMQSLNEELSSSNEELQSANEELETTNEELQSTNEELQTAYAELKVLYDDKENRSRQLEDMANKLLAQSETLRQQKEITEGIINITPVAITMIDSHGLITFANTNALNLYKLSHKEITNRRFDSERWFHRDPQGVPLSKDELPFSKIQRTFEPVHNEIYTLTTGEGNPITIIESGAPLFDARGAFIGAVFSAQESFNRPQTDMTIDSLASSLSRFQSSFITSHRDEAFSLASLITKDLYHHLKNDLGDVTLLCQTLQAPTAMDDHERTLSLMHQKLTSLVSKLQERVTYFDVAIYTESIVISMLIERSIAMMNDLLHDHEIETLCHLDTQIHPVCPTRVGLLSIFEIFESLITSKIHASLHEPAQLSITNTRDDDHVIYHFGLTLPSTPHPLTSSSIGVSLREALEGSRLSTHIADSTLFITLRIPLKAQT